MKYILFFILFGFTAFTAKAKIDTVNIYSPSLFKDVKCAVVTPDLYKKKKYRFPVVYLLNGFGGNYTNWVKRVSDMQQLSDENQMILVCPDGANSWYFNSPVDLTKNYETNVAEEIPAYIDANYRTIADRKARAITGLSMGGHGGLFLAWRHSGTFGACGSMSGALDISQITTGYNMKNVLGDTAINMKYYNDWSVYNLIDKYPADSLAIIIDCGLQDFIFQMSKRTHEKMVKLKIPHDYIERPGKHDFNYWSIAVRYQLLFFKEYFKKNGMGIMSK